jgi:protoporphyrinogen oxidase
MKRIVIIGAGMTGLVAGYELGKSGYQVTIFEKNNDIGGLMGGFKIGSTSLEKTYHHIFKTDKYIIDLIRELGLKDKLKWHPDKTAVYFEGNKFPFTAAKDLWDFSPLNIIDKIRLAMVGLVLGINPWGKMYAKKTAVEWMKKWCGKNAYEIIWEPLLKGKFDKYYDKVSMAWLWARIHTRGNSGKLGYLDGGFQQIADELAKRIKENSGEIILNSEVDVKKIENDFDRVIYTGPIKGVNYLGAMCVIFTSEQYLSPYYWHNINDVNSPFVAFIQHTNLVDKKFYGNKNVYYLGKYLPNNDKLIETDNKVIIKKYFDYLKIIFPEFDTGLVEKTWVFKLKNAQHVVDIKYKVPEYQINDKVFQANFAQIYPEDRGINFAVREGKKIAEKISLAR